MSTPISAVPTGQRLFPYLSVRDAASAIDFYARAFGAREVFRLPMPDGRIGHAKMSLDDVSFWLADEFPEMQIRGPASLGGTTVSLAFYVPDVDAFVERARDAGATVERPVRDEFYGDRVGIIVDPFGHRWALHSRREEVSPDEMRRRMEAGSRES